MYDDRKVTVLLLEDDLILARLYEDKFSLEGFNVIVEHDGEVGLQKALHDVYDVLLLDVGLPSKNGLDVLAELRRDPRGNEIPVIVLTNIVDQKEKERASKLNAQEYLVKAMQTPEQVVEKIKEHL